MFTNSRLHIVVGLSCCGDIVAPRYDRVQIIFYHVNTYIELVLSSFVVFCFVISVDVCDEKIKTALINVCNDISLNCDPKT